MIVVTGASGFVGRHLVARLGAEHRSVRAVSRSGGGLATRADLERAADWPAVLEGAQALVHLAAHNPPPGAFRARRDAAAFRRVNVEASARLAARAAAAGVKRIVFTSSIRAYATGGIGRFAESDPLRAADPYGASKAEAEAAIAAALEGSGTRLTVLRPPMIYGVERTGLLGLLARAVRTGVPVPVVREPAERSVLAVGNMVDAVLACLDDESPSDRVFNVADGRATSVRALAELIGKAQGRAPRFAVVPSALAVASRSIPGAGALAARLLQPSAVQIDRIRETLGWTPPSTTAEAVRVTFGDEAGGR
ncbi:NAD-dependent epimerase/dehydratase family protein [Pararhizobium mangrovi]|uniref:NAD-dependent epimerase/dehydratase family protein n=1 Tax=Pararhizobium mangrovi TaxID=2590452 RepID=A0A506U6H6_9HYPH|nr:NAD-dependent epimerase/dehydratase family protein [Pararhizobium mangrovi]TPW28691.1 NAD-dependent epimerase/dehydratase family protein [Pararhizobium mangrovi]